MRSEVLSLELRRAYEEASYLVSYCDQLYELRAGTHSSELAELLSDHFASPPGGAREWAVITAWNPGSEILPLHENCERQFRLEAELDRCGHTWHSALGVGAGLPPAHAETSCLVVGISRTQAVKLALKFGQAAILTGDRLGDGATPRVVTCESIWSEAVGGRRL